MLTARPISLVDQMLANFERAGLMPSIAGGDHPPATPPVTPPADPPKDPKDPPADPPKDDWKPSPEQQEHINRWLAAERKKTEERLQTEAAQREQQAKEQRERDEAEKRGEFDTVKKSLEEKASTAEADRDAMKSRLEVYEGLVRKDVEASWSSIPEEVRETYDGADDDVLAKKQHMDRNAKIIERLTAAATPPSVNPPNPPPGGPTDVKIESPMTARQILS